MMRALRWMFALAVCGLGGLPAACGGDVEQTFGPANGLKGQTPPEPDTTGTSMPPPPDAGTQNDGGTTGGDGGTVGEGGGTGEGGNAACSGVTWSGTVYPLFAAQGAGQCASGNCHGGVQLPSIPDGNATGAYTSLAGYAISTAQGTKPYFATSGNTADSAVECNLTLPANQIGICSAAANGMPLAPGSLSATQKATIEQWVKCGAPNN
jgi:hypothetical protein